MVQVYRESNSIGAAIAGHYHLANIWLAKQKLIGISDNFRDFVNQINAAGLEDDGRGQEQLLHIIASSDHPPFPKPLIGS